MRFIKMHGAGNDYVYVNGFEQTIDDPAAVAQRVSDRHTGIGSDGLILLLPADNGVQADLRMQMFNADGSESEMCGNGIRCVCKFAHDHGITNSKPMTIQTGAGLLSLDFEVGEMDEVTCVTVDMGEPIIEPAKVPVYTEKMLVTDEPHSFHISPGGSDEWFAATFVSMGNPHAVIYVDAIDPEPMLHLGAELEKHPAFPNRMNIHFVHVESPNEVTVLHWERGSGATLACGTGACAVGVAGVLTGRTDRELLTHLPGGDLNLRWDEASNHVFMTGPAVEVFSGEWPS